MGQDVASSKLVKMVDELDHTQGSASAVVTLVEYADFQCEDSGAAYPIIKDIQWRSGDWIQFVFRNFPLVDIHPFARKAAEAAEAAGAQGLFWEMHDYLFENQDIVDEQSIMDFAEEMGLDVDQFAQDMLDPTCIRRIDDDMESGKRSGVNQTPTFFINGMMYKGAVEVDSMLKAIQSAAEDLSEK